MENFTFQFNSMLPSSTQPQQHHENGLIDREIEQMLLQVDPHHPNHNHQHHHHRYIHQEMMIQKKLPQLKIDTSNKPPLLLPKITLPSSAFSEKSMTSNAPPLPSLMDCRSVPACEFPLSAPILPSNLGTFNFDMPSIPESASILSPLNTQFFPELPVLGLSDLTIISPETPLNNVAFEHPYTSTPLDHHYPHGYHHYSHYYHHNMSSPTSTSKRTTKKRKNQVHVSTPLTPKYGVAWPTEDVERRAYAAAAGSQDMPCEFPGCTRTFNRLQNLKSHWRCHSEEKPYACSDCGFSFRRLPDLYRHRRSVHNDGKPHQCHGCGKQFARADALRRHLQYKNGKAPVCMTSQWIVDSMETLA